MLRLVLKLLLAAAALWAIFAFVPFGGRTLADRWRASRSPSEFVERTWAEMKGVPEKPAAKARPPARSQARAQGPAARDRTGDRPSEGHTDADRRAVDRIVTEHLSEPR
ncbi:hypothetical protein [Anaeromyxobacter oryzae]|uniref:Secreted protein n=1 Tax=Anaeromyxobacter oryzae TaxID=2918170 RepID=A0ABM7WRC3_9BACT|nr:hypothetical protein [Anaeromyxobacter oryzae]BDG02010.1 hypothetical protein AMOR_10060 [Anaeromyxobacter oryzae]